MIATALRHPATLAGQPIKSWAFSIRIWAAVVVALCVSFWLQLEAPSTAAVTIAILSEPTRGQALEKAIFRFAATIIGVAASFLLVGLFAQARDLMLMAFAALVGLSIYAAKLFDGYRTYAAVLSGYTAALVAIQHIDTPQQVFETSMARGAAIAVGITSIAVVNDLFFAPDRHSELSKRLTGIHRRMQEFAKAVLYGEAPNPAISTSLIQQIVALRSEVSSLATESSSGPVKSAAARSAIVALVSQLRAIRTLQMLVATGGPGIRRALSSATDPFGDTAFDGLFSVIDVEEERVLKGAITLRWALEEVRQLDREVRYDLAALQSGTKPLRSLQAPFYRSYRIAFESGLRGAGCWALAALFFILAGWPAASGSLALVAVVIGLGATTPDPRRVTLVGLIMVPLAVVLAGIFEFLVLDGVSEFQLLALGLAPIVVVPALMIAQPNQLLSASGRIFLLFILALLSLSNPYTYNPQTFLFMSLFVGLAICLVLAGQTLITPLPAKRRQWLIESARRDLHRIMLSKDLSFLPEEATFRDAVRIGQIAALGNAGQRDSDSLEEVLSYFDQAGAIRRCNEKLERLAGGPSANLVAEAQAALIELNSVRIRAAALCFQALNDPLTVAASGALFLASVVTGPATRELRVQQRKRE